MRRPFLSALLGLAILLGQSDFANAAPSDCGNGIVDAGEECDPGGAITIGAIEGGTPCTSGGTCFFVESGGCCKFNCQAVGSGLACDDGNECSVGEKCNNVGVCTCSGGCDPDAAVGATCRPSAGPCDAAEICLAGIGCPADAPATAGTECRPSSGECDPAETCNGSSFTCPPEANPLGTPCTTDGNVCTDDVCDGAGICGHVNNTAPCSDSLFCNGADTCSGGACVGHSGDPCSGGAVCNNGPCNEATDSCVSPAGTACPSDSNVCTDDVCNGAGACGVANTAPCNDSLYCNGSDTCSGGTCAVHAGNPCTGGPECADSCNETADNCFDLNGTACTDDGNTCTNDQCNGSGTCAHPNNTAPCNDGLFCNGADTCSGGSCSAHVGDPCASGSECADACNETADNCFDLAGTACSTDNNVCTNDLCSGTGACNHINNTNSCDDGKFCTVSDICGGGACTGTARNCSDSNTCTTDSCNEAGDTCVNSPSAGVGTPCDDSNVCTLNTACNISGACTGGTPLNCDDATACTVDSCQPITGCQHIAEADTRNCGTGCEDGVDNEDDGTVDFEDPKCSTLAPVLRFAVVSTHDTSRKALYAGSDVTVSPIDADGTCVAGTCACATPGPVNCRSKGVSCSDDSDCRTSVPGTCNLPLNECECPSWAPNCQALERECDDDEDCALRPYPFSDSNAGLCGYSMEIRAGTRMGLLATSGNVGFGKGTTIDRNLDIQNEFSSDGGNVFTKTLSPLVGPTVCSSQLDLVCDEHVVCPAAPADVCVLGQCSGHEEACLVDADCEAACDARRRTGDGVCSNNAAQHCMLDSECGMGNTCDHPFVATDGTSENFSRCDSVLQLNPMAASGVSAELKAIADAIAAYTPGGGEQVAFPGACEACPLVTTPFGDPSCVPCPDATQIKANSGLQKFGVTVGGGLQILDLERIKLPGLTELHLLGQEDTTLVIRVARGMRLGGAAKIVLGSNGGLGNLDPEFLLWNFAGKSGGGPAISRDAIFYGTILAPERPGVRTGSTSQINGAIYSRKVQLKQTTTINHIPFTPLLPVTP